MKMLATLIVLSTLGIAPWLATTAQQTPIPNMAGKVLTVDGPITPERLGQTLMHEHVFSDFNLPWDAPNLWTLADRHRPTTATQEALYNAPLALPNLGDVTLGAPNHDNWLLDDEKLAIAEVGHFKTAGGGTLVDTTSIGLGRQPEKLQKVSQATGVNLVMGSSWYGAAWTPADLATRSVASLTDEIVHDVTVGVKGTHIRAGIIGEVATDAHPDSAIESKIIRASARASRLTGAAVTIDASDTDRQQGQILDMLAAEGADLSRVVLAHTAYLPGDEDYLIALMKRGATIEFDVLGRPQTIARLRPLDSVVAKGIVKLVKAGYAKQIVLSENVHSKTSLRAYGGTGYDYIETLFVPYIKHLGMSDADLHTMLVENPRRLLTFVAPKPALAGH